MQIDVSKAGVLESYHMLVDVVTPRPIAWVTSMDREGRVNLARSASSTLSPTFAQRSSFPRSSAAMGRRRIRCSTSKPPEFVLNAAVEPLAEQVDLSSKELPHGSVRSSSPAFPCFRRSRCVSSDRGSGP